MKNKRSLGFLRTTGLKKRRKMKTMLSVNSRRFGYKIISKNSVIFKRCSKSKHFLTTPFGIAVDAETFNEALSEGVKFVQIFEREEEVYYSVSVEQFRKKAISIDRGYGRQLALPLSYFLASKSKEIPRMVEQKPLPLLFPIKSLNPKPENKQPSLFARCTE